VKEEGAGLAEMELYDDMYKVQPMVEQYDENKFPSMIIMKGKGKPFAC
jgi:hypothetical protein